MPAGMNSQVVQIKESSAGTWTTSTDILEQDAVGQSIKQMDYPRILSKIGIAGSTAFAGGMVVKIQDMTVAKILTSETVLYGHNLSDVTVDAQVPAGASVIANPTAASGTNPYVVFFEFDIDPAIKVAALQRASYMARTRRRY